MKTSWIARCESTGVRWPDLKLVLAVSACLVGLSGCGGAVDLVPVEGTVTLDGQPVSDAGVMFTPKKEGHGLPAAGTTDANGHFVLSTTNRPGAMIGEYRVVISKTELPDLPRGPNGEVDETRLNEVKELKEVNYLPARYTSADASELNATVNSSGGNFTFSLTRDETVAAPRQDAMPEKQGPSSKAK